MILIGLVGGIMIGSGVSLLSARALPGTCWILNFKALDTTFAPFMSALFLIALAGLGLAAFFTEHQLRRRYIFAFLLLVAAIAITLAGNVDECCGTAMPSDCNGLALSGTQRCPKPFCAFTELTVIMIDPSQQTI